MYVDILFIENFIINFLILNITSKFSKLKTTRTRLFIGSAVGALYIIIAFFPELKIFFSLSMKLIMSMLMIIIVYTPEKIYHFFKALGIFYLISFSFGGAAFAIFYFTGKGNVINGAFYIKDFPMSVLITAFAVGYLLLSYCWDYVIRKKLGDELIYNLRIELFEKNIDIVAIVDTCNSLKDPITNSPVIVVELDAIRNSIPDSINHIFDSIKGDIDLSKLYSLSNDSSIANRIRIIPFTSLGKQNGILIGIKPDNVFLINEGYIKQVTNVIVGIHSSKISKDGRYNALLYPEIIL